MNRNKAKSLLISNKEKSELDLAREDAVKGRVTIWKSVDDLFDKVLGE